MRNREAGKKARNRPRQGPHVLGRVRSTTNINTWWTKTQNNQQEAAESMRPKQRWWLHPRTFPQQSVLFLRLEQSYSRPDSLTRLAGCSLFLSSDLLIRDCRSLVHKLSPANLILRVSCLVVATTECTDFITLSFLYRPRLNITFFFFLVDRIHRIYS